MTKTRRIQDEESIRVEKLFYETSALESIIHFLINSPNIDKEILNQQIINYKNSYTDLEMAKRELSHKYKPTINTEVTSYKFDFPNYSIIYEYKDN